MNSVTQRLNFSGADSLLQVLQGISAAVRAEILEPAVVAAAAPIQSAIRARAPRQTGALAESIAVKGLSNKNAGTAVALIGPSHDAVRKALGLSRRAWRHFRKQYDVETAVRYAHLLEYGHVTQSGGFVAARPFMRPGLEAGAPAAGKIMVEKVSDGIEKARARLVAKGSA